MCGVSYLNQHFIVITFVYCFQKQFTKMANTQLKKKKKGLVAANGLNNDAGKTLCICGILGTKHWLARYIYILFFQNHPRPPPPQKYNDSPLSSSISWSNMGSPQHLAEIIS